jgi:Tfp pilus assembly protein PilO
MKALTKEKRDQLILTALLTLAILAGLYLGLISTQKKSFAHINNQIVEQKTKVSNAEKLIRSAPEMEAQLEKNREKLRGIELGMASGDMYSWIFLTINKFRANHRNVDIPQFSREVAVEPGIIPRFPYKAVLFNVRGTAYYHDLGKFLADFENTFPYMRVQNVELDPVGATTGSAAPSSTGGSTAGANNGGDTSEKLNFKMEIVALVNPNSR